MFGLDPFNPAVAVVEMLLLLALAALVGWLLGRLVRAGRVNALRSSVADKEAELAECRRAKVAGADAGIADQNQNTLFDRQTIYPEPRAGDTVAFVSADPLLPAFSHDDMPDMMAGPVVEPLPEVPPGPNWSEGVVPVEVPPIGAPIPVIPPVMPPTPTPAPSAPPEPLPGAVATGNSEAAVLNRIAARAGELNFDRIGRAAAADADDLKDIVGIGPFLERKIHSLGIYTFRQVANFTKEDIDKVNEIIEFFPGRIERDNWVEQAKGLHQRKYNTRPEA